MKNWLEPVVDIFRAETNDLRELAVLVGGDPTTFYVGTALNNIDLSSQDLRGMHFTGLDTAPVVFDDTTQLDQRYWVQLSANRNAIRKITTNILSKEEFEEIAPKARTLLQNIEAEPHYEDRLGLLLRAVLDDAIVGLLVAKNLREDKSTTVLRTAEALGEMLEFHQLDDRAHLQLEVTRIAEQLLKHAIMYNRGKMLLGLANHLVDYPTIGPFLRARLRKRGVDVADMD
jgi:hypothetical protein